MKQFLAFILKAIVLVSKYAHEIVRHFTSKSKKHREDVSAMEEVKSTEDKEGI